jgi:hypothetical protein
LYCHLQLFALLPVGLALVQELSRPLLHAFQFFLQPNNLCFLEGKLPCEFFDVLLVPTVFYLSFVPVEGEETFEAVDVPEELLHVKLLHAPHSL